MPEIAIRLDPKDLENPNADLRYLLPDAIVSRTPTLLADDGYDYDDAGRMLVFLHTQQIDEAVAAVLKALAETELLGNRFDNATVGVSQESHSDDLAQYRIVHPPHFEGSLADTPPKCKP
jgi:hypothetical protein